MISYETAPDLSLASLVRFVVHVVDLDACQLLECAVHVKRAFASVGEVHAPVENVYRRSLVFAGVFRSRLFESGA